MRFLLTLLTIGALIYGGWWVDKKHPRLKHKVMEMIHSGSFHTLEIRFSADQIMENHRRELLKDSRHQFLEPSLKFYPYLLLEVKYMVSEDKTCEGVILWDLTDGEMVLNTRDWEKTHGFGDCIKANAERHEFKILNILARKGGTSDRRTLSKALHVENEILDAWIDSCRKKQLIVQAGNNYRLHLQKPRLQTFPETKLDDKLVTMPYRDALRLPRRYSVSQIQKITKAAFGNDFAIRSITDVYLPVHSIVVQNPDRSIHTSHWNALTGKRLSLAYLLD